jgi:transcriptional regulator with XRE-family HTH domain
MKFGQKLDKLTIDRNRAEVSRRAGLPKNAISDYVNKGYIPRLDTAASLARELGVSLDWLADDGQEWPPSKTISSPAKFSDDELMMEVASRYRQNAIRLRTLVNNLKAVDWGAVARMLYEIPIGEKLPPDAQKAVNALYMASTMMHFAPTLYDARIQADLHHASMPSGGFSPEQLDVNKTLVEWDEWMREVEPITMVEMYMNWDAHRDISDAESRERAEQMRLQYLKQIRTGRYTPEKLSEARAQNTAHRARKK